MTAYVPQLIVSRWLTALLRADSAVRTAVGSEKRINADLSPSEEIARQLTHAHAGGNVTALPIGAPVAMVTMLWDVIGWEPKFSRQPLDTLMTSVVSLLIGTDMSGKIHRFTDSVTGKNWTITVDYPERDNEPVSFLDLSSTPVWAPVRERFQISLMAVA